MLWLLLSCDKTWMVWQFQQPKGLVRPSITKTHHRSSCNGNLWSSYQLQKNRITAVQCSDGGYLLEALLIFFKSILQNWELSRNHFTATTSRLLKWVHFWISGYGNFLYASLITNIKSDPLETWTPLRSSTTRALSRPIAADPLLETGAPLSEHHPLLQLEIQQVLFQQDLSVTSNERCLISL